MREMEEGDAPGGGGAGTGGERTAPAVSGSHRGDDSARDSD